MATKTRNTGKIVVEVKEPGEDWGLAAIDGEAGTTTKEALAWVRQNVEAGSEFRVIRLVAHGTVKAVTQHKLDLGV